MTPTDLERIAAAWDEYHAAPNSGDFATILRRMARDQSTPPGESGGGKAGQVRDVADVPSLHGVVLDHFKAQSAPQDGGPAPHPFSHQFVASVSDVEFCWRCYNKREHPIHSSAQAGGDGITGHAETPDRVQDVGSAGSTPASPDNLHHGEDCALRGGDYACDCGLDDELRSRGPAPTSTTPRSGAAPDGGALKPWPVDIRPCGGHFWIGEDPRHCKNCSTLWDVWVMQSKIMSAGQFVARYDAKTRAASKERYDKFIAAWNRRAAPATAGGTFWHETFDHPKIGQFVLLHCPDRLNEQKFIGGFYHERDWFNDRGQLLSPNIKGYPARWAYFEDIDRLTAEVADYKERASIAQANADAEHAEVERLTRAMEVMRGTDANRCREISDLSGALATAQKVVERARIIHVTQADVGQPITAQLGIALEFLGKAVKEALEPAPASGAQGER